MPKSRWSGTAVALVLSLGACSGGEGSRGSVAYIPPPPPPPFQLPDPVTSPSSAEFDTAEYRKSSAALISAIPAYQAGASGKGIKVGIVDTGLDPTLSEFAGRIDPASRDVADDRPMEDLWGHGTGVASIIAAAKDDSGIHGVAYGATILMMKADMPGSCPQSCSFDTDDVAEAIDAARLAGAKVINLSIGGSGSDEILDAIRRAAAAGIIIVIGAGNDTGTVPSLLAQKAAAAAPEYVIIVGALGALVNGEIDYNQLITSSNQAGKFQTNYLAAPGALKMLKLDGSLGNVAATSYSAPVVSGALALLAEAFPNLTARQLIDILFMTADDLGVDGVDSVFGYGRLNIGRAFQPIGQTTLASTGLPVSMVVNGTLPAAAGDAAERGLLNAIVLDAFSRAFKVDLAQTLKRAGLETVLSGIGATDYRTAESAIGPLALTLTVRQPAFDRHGESPATQRLSEQEASAARLFAASAILRLSSRSVGLSTKENSGTLQRRLRSEDTSAFFLTKNVRSDPGFIARDVTSIGARQEIGALGVSVTSEAGEVLTERRDQNSSRYTLGSLSLDGRIGDDSYTVGLGYLRERRTILGGYLNGVFGEGGAITLFLDGSAAVTLGRGWIVNGHVRRGWTNFTAGSFMTSAYSVQIQRSGIASKSDQISISVAQPLRVEKGGLTLLLPRSYDYSTATAGFERSTLSWTPAAREIAVEAAYSTNFGGGHLRTNLFARIDPGHSANSKHDIGGAVQFGFRF